MNPTNADHDHDVSDAGFDNVLAEYMLRVDRGESVDREAYVRDHPAFAAQLRHPGVETENVWLLEARKDAGRSTDLRRRSEAVITWSSLSTK